MQINSAMALYNYKIPALYKKNKNFTFCPGKSRENFAFFSRTFQDLQTQFKDFPGQQKKKNRTFPGCGNPECYTQNFQKGQYFVGPL